MKKALNISLGGTLFYIEEDAYQKLDSYLGSVRKHFATYPDGDEVVKDIEARIAEQFASLGRQIITIVDVDRVVSAMGDARDFGDEGAAEEGSGGGAKVEKRLFRNPDDVIIAGVCSGIASYIGADPTVVRLLFLVSLLFGGFGVLLYIVLWLIVPEAKTPTEKLQMRGDAVTLESVSDLVKEKAAEFKDRADQGMFRKIVAVPVSIVRTIGSGLKRFSPALARIIGVILFLASLAALTGVLIAFVTAITTYPSPTIDFPIAESMHGPMLYVAVSSLFLLVVIPVVFLMLAALSLLRLRNAFTGRAALPLTAVWLLSAVAVGVVAVKTAALHAEFVRNDPSYQQATKAFDASGFKEIRASNGQRIVLAQGPEFSVTGEGRRRDLDNVEVAVVDGALTVGRRDDLKVCIFCFRDPVTVTVTAPDIDVIRLSTGARLETPAQMTGDSLTIDLRNGSSALLRAELAESVGITAANASRAELIGSAPALGARLSNGSKLIADELSATSVTLSLSNGSRADVLASSSLDVSASNGSTVRYQGRPIVRNDLSNGSSVKGAWESGEADDEDFGNPTPPAPPEAVR